MKAAKAGMVEKTVEKALDAGVNKMEDFLDDGKINGSNVPGGLKPKLDADGNPVPEKPSGLDGVLNSGAQMIANATNSLHSGVEGAVKSKNGVKATGSAAPGTTGTATDNNGNVIECGLMVGAIKNETISNAHKKHILPIMHELDQVKLEKRLAMQLLVASILVGGISLIILSFVYPKKRMPALKLGAFFTILGPLGMPAALYIMIKIYKNSKNPGFIPVNSTSVD